MSNKIDSINIKGELYDCIDRDLRIQVDSLSNYVTPQMFGAVANGITDDTKAIYAAMNSGSSVLLYGEYAVSKPIIGIAPYVHGINSKINILNDIDTVFTLNFATHISGIEFNCQNHVTECCILSSGTSNIEILDIYIHDVYNNRNDIGATLISVIGSEIVNIDNIHVENCYQLGDGTIGNAEGNISCIYVTNYTKHCSI
jgi:hypothetical protein